MEEIKRIGVIGLGYVGLTHALLLAHRGHLVFGMDKDRNKLNMLKKGVSYIYEKNIPEFLEQYQSRLYFNETLDEVAHRLDMVVVCVNTPQKEDGACNTQYLFDAIRNLPQNLPDTAVIVIKSTVEVGTSNKVQKLTKNPVVFCPEFLAQGTAIQDAINPSRVVIGGQDRIAMMLTKNVLADPDVPSIITDWETAEMIKCVSNAFLATKISFINEVSNLCAVFGANISVVSKGIGLDKRIGPHFLNAGMGYGGSCFDKDLSSLCYMAHQKGRPLKIVEATCQVNEQQKLLVVSMAKKILGCLGGKICSILGLSFKAETNDARNSPALDVVHALLAEGAIVKLYDPVAKVSFQNEYAGKYGTFLADTLFYDNTRDALSDTEMCFITTEWENIKNLRKEDFMETMKTPIVIDGRFCLKFIESDGNVILYRIGENISNKNLIRNDKLQLNVAL